MPFPALQYQQVMIPVLFGHILPGRISWLSHHPCVGLMKVRSPALPALHYQQVMTLGAARIIHHHALFL